MIPSRREVKEAVRFMKVSECQSPACLECKHGKVLSTVASSYLSGELVRCPAKGEASMMLHNLAFHPSDYPQVMARLTLDDCNIVAAAILRLMKGESDG